MKAIILAAGLGTRLQPLTNTIPKSMLPINNRPLIHYQIEWLHKHGIDDIAINLHHLPMKIKEYLGDGSRLCVNITYSYEKELLGTAGAIKRLEQFIDGKQFLIFYGDNLATLPINQLLDYHNKKKGIMTICLHKRQENENDFGIVSLDKHNKIIEFIEKPNKIALHQPMLINSGIYLAEPDILKFIPKDTFFDFAYGLFPLLLKKNMQIYGYLDDCYWRELGNIEKYNAVVKEFNEV